MIHFALLQWCFMGALAGAQLDVWRLMDDADLHTGAFAVYDGPARALFSPCDAKGDLSLPSPYEKDYSLTKKELAVLDRSQKAAKKYSNIQDALDAGYLPSPRGFIQSAGLALIHPDLIRDGKVDWDKPDILTFVKKKRALQFRLVGMVFAGGEEAPAALSEFKRIKARPKSDTGADGWGYSEEVCAVVEPKESVRMYYGASETPDHCKNGKYFKQMWMLSMWTLLYNPNGLFVDENPMVDHLDRSQQFGSFCPKGKGNGT
ncbi:MAG: hypothetical protein HY925_04855 [Elusimicrobia bacterium]|nr:hypothetical protein [Elusimicrobiota bacterium]